MRQLLVDMGNTRLKWAHLPAAEAQTGGVFVHRDADLAALLTQAWSGLPVPDRLLVACVASAGKKQAFLDWIQQHWNCRVDFLSSPPQGHGVTNSYAQAQQLGSDRWAALVAVRAKTTAPVCVVNCGSAVTIDVLDLHGQHQGGLILPGLHAMLEALGTRTGLPALDMSVAEQFAPLANSTRDAMLAGAVLSIVALIEKTLAGLQQNPTATPGCYLAGGDAQHVSVNLGVAHKVETDLVLQGLAIIAQST